MFRTHTCWELTSKNIWEEVILSWRVNKNRNLWWLNFIDLRDRYGITQITIDPDNTELKNNASDLEWLLRDIKSEYVLKISWKVSPRPDNMVNKNMITWEIEIIPVNIEILSICKELPFPIDHGTPVWEDIRLEYRYLDLRREKMKDNVIMRHKLYIETMKFFNEKGFLHLETPTFIKNTPEGSREFVVPARFEPGKFFVLPQSPQQHKQMLMVAWFDKYYQMARCYRDEDPRGDRQPEFTQVDFELSFVEQQDILDLMEEYCKLLAKKYYSARPIKADPFPVLTWENAMNTYGIDKPELRVENVKLIELTDRAKKSEFWIFQEAECIKGIVVPKEMGRSEIEKKYEGFIKNKGSKALPWLCFTTTEGIKGSIAKFFSETDLQELKTLTGIKEWETIFFQADTWLNACNYLGMLRNELIKKLELTKGKEDELAFCFIVDMPLFEEGDDGELWSTHHPFTTPSKADIPFIKELGKKLSEGGKMSKEEKTHLLNIKSDTYDMILNGYELGGGSIRIHDSELQHAIFSLLGLSDQQIQVRFGHLLKCFEYWVPPHGGCAFGFDRIVMLFQKMENIREVIAFPKNQKYRDLMLNAPSEIDDDLLNSLWLEIIDKK